MEINFAFLALFQPFISKSRNIPGPSFAGGRPSRRTQLHCLPGPMVGADSNAG